MSEIPGIDRLPAALAREVEQAWEALVEARPDAARRLQDAGAAWQSLAHVWGSSPFVAQACRDRGLLEALLASGDLERAFTAPGEIRQRLEAELEGVADEAELMARLRRFRRREMVRIAWRDLAGLAGTEEVLTGLSWLADACVDAALVRLHAWLAERHGQPRNAQGEAQGLVVLGMGKLGGEELNYSSDIDLIFAFDEEGETDGRRPLANSQFFTKLGQRLIQVIDQQTADGFVFRVDMRLRPNGEGAPLALSFDAMEAYYATQGREWERYALIKARVIAGDRDAGAELFKTLQPFVYRRYLDYGAFARLREMKAMIEKEIQRQGMADNLKLGPGGIREVEFVGQAFQLIRGGREHELQGRRLLPVLDYLGEAGYLPAFAVSELKSAYDFLRRAENRLQMAYDRQTQALPEDETERARLALAMEFADWPAFESRLREWMATVHEHFRQVFAAPQAAENEEETEVDRLWRGTLADSRADALLAEMGFADPGRAEALLEQVRAGHAYRAMTEVGRRRMDQLMPLLVRAAGRNEAPEETLERLVKVIQAIARRTVYLALLVENPMALSQLVRLCADSIWVTELIARQPILLDELLDPRTLYAPPQRAELEEELDLALSRIEPDDQEQQLDALRHFRQSSVLRVAAADLADAMRLMQVSDRLTDIAEVIIQRVLGLAEGILGRRHGRPGCRVDGETRHPSLGIVAYGKLGGIELGYGSDLDLVFLHDSEGEQAYTDGAKPLDNASFFARLAQRVIHFLGVRTRAGVLYEVDTRLRPNGAAGLLVSSLRAFELYQANDAWTWEHQALVRARMVAGSPHLREAFERIRAEVLGQPRDRGALLRDVTRMRERMRQQLDTAREGQFHLKHGPGGITDIEFMVQFLVLAHAADHPKLLEYTDNIRLLQTLAAEDLLPDADAELLIDAYRDLRNRTHRLALQGQPTVGRPEEYAGYREGVRRIWGEVMAE